MVASVQSPADLANIAFVRMGFKDRVASLYEGSDQAKNTLDIYAQTRDEKLREYDYDFAERSLSLTLLKSAPVGGYFPPNAWDPTLHPAPGFGFEYEFPEDAIKVRVVKPQPLFVMNANPQANSFQIASDNGYTPSRRVILCNVPAAIATYTGQVTAPALWDVAFVEALAAALSRRLAPVLMGPNAVAAAARDEAIQSSIAEMEQR